MRAIFLFGLFVLSLLTSLLLSAERAYAWSWGGKDSRGKEFISTKVLNDSLVRNLSCSNLSVSSIYVAIRDDAFDEKRNMPIRNWPFYSGAVPLAGCWGLSSTQRMFSYLIRYNENSATSSEERTELALNMVRRASVELVDNGSNKMVHDFTLRNYRVIPVREDSFRDEYAFGRRDLWTDMLIGFTMNLDGNKVVRNFREDIQKNQVGHFFRFGNIGMGVGSGVRSIEENKRTLQHLMVNLMSKRLTLLNLRVDQTTQHVVMAKSYKRDYFGNVTIKVYDSNQFEKDREIQFKAVNQQFYAPDVMGAFGARGPVGVFIVSEDEREGLEKTLMTYYREKCR